MFQRLGAFHTIWKKLHIASVYDRHINLLLFLVHAYPHGATKKVMSCTLNGSKWHMITIYDFMKTNEQKAWLVIKK
jgi:catabolite regulation protein CreA